MRCLILVFISFAYVSCTGRHSEVQSMKQKQSQGANFIGGFSFDKNNGEFLFNKKLMKDEYLIKQYGRGCMLCFHRCYDVPDQGLHIYFSITDVSPREIDAIFVSKDPNCLCTPKTPGISRVPKIPFNKLATAEGIGIGDSVNKVVEIYGTPARILKGDGTYMVGVSGKEMLETSPFGDLVYAYFIDNDECGSCFYFRDGKLTAILISCSE